MTEIEQLTPKDVFSWFEQISRIPRGSSDTGRISAWLCGFAAERHLECYKDEIGNVLIKAPGTAGYEASPAVILQGHMDMVCEKESESDHDFGADPLRLRVVDGMLWASGTTLGADDGIGLAYILAILDGDYPHPPIEALITVDEEIGMLGASAFDCSQLLGRRLINLDNEVEEEIIAGCAGGVRIDVTLPVSRTEGTGAGIEIRLGGLIGGHSGVDIDKGRANAAVTLGRLLYELGEEYDFSLLELEAGGRDNVIPVSGRAKLLVSEADAEAFMVRAREIGAAIKREYEGSDDGLAFTISRGEEKSGSALDSASLTRCLFFLRLCPNGIHKRAGFNPKLVETSCNLGILSLKEGEMKAGVLVRSSFESARDELKGRIVFLGQLLGGSLGFSGLYPSWEYLPESELRQRAAKLYEEMHGKAPVVDTIHAGLECGILYHALPGLDAIAIGPTMHGVHTPHEHLDIASTGRTFSLLLSLLASLKE